MCRGRSGRFLRTIIPMGRSPLRAGPFITPRRWHSRTVTWGHTSLPTLAAGWIHRLTAAIHTEADFATGGTGIVALAVDNEGSLYYLEHYTGKLDRITLPISSVVPFTAPEVASDFVLNVDAAPVAAHRFILNYDPAVDVATLSQPGAVQVTQRAGALRANATLVSINAISHTSLWQVVNPTGWVPGRTSFPRQTAL